MKIVKTTETGNRRFKYTKLGRTLYPMVLDSIPNRNPKACDDKTFEIGNPEIIEEPVFEHDNEPFEVTEE